MKKLLVNLFIVGLLIAGLAAAPSYGQKPVKIRLAVFMNETETKTLEEFLTEYKKMHPNIETSVENIVYRAAMEKFMTMVAGRTAPEIGYGLDRWVLQLGLFNVVADLNDYLTPGWQKNYPDKLLSQGQYQGKQLGLPNNAKIQAILLNRDFFDKAGVKYPYTNEKDSWTLDEYIENSVKAAKAGGAQFPILWWPSTICCRIAPIYAFGKGIFTPDGKAGALSDPETIQILKKMEKTFKDGLAPRDNWSAGLNVNKMMVDGRAATLFHQGSFSIPWQRAHFTTYNWDFTFCIREKEGAVPNGTDQYFIFSQAKRTNRVEAAKLIEFLTNRENSARWGIATSSLPARTDIDNLLRYDYRPELMKFFTEAIKGINPRFRYETILQRAYTEVDLRLRPISEQMALEKIDAEEFARRADATIKEVLAEYGD